MLNTSALCSDIHIKAGILDTSPATTAPIPRETNNAGKAQHNKVLNEANKLKNAEIDSFRLSSINYGFRLISTRL